MNPCKIATCLFAVALCLTFHAAFAQENKPTLSSIAHGETANFKADQDLVKAIRNAKIIKTDYPLRVLRSGNEVLVTTLVNAKATEKSSKIDAVLVAKAIMDRDKKVLIVHYRTKVHMRDSDCLAIVVKQSDVMAYGLNAINVDSLLAELKIVKHGGRHERGQ